MSAELATLDGAQLAERIRAEYRGFLEAREIFISAGRLALERAVKIGELFSAAMERFPGNFEEWREANFPGDDGISRTTAWRFRKCFDRRDHILADEPDLATLKDAYVDLGLMPPPERDHKNAAATRPLYTLKLVLDTSKPLKDWPRIELMDFLKQTAKVAELREEAEALLAEE